ncbi:MAG TPA: DedA family protein [Candidatus Dormibacteraeota bacterium]
MESFLLDLISRFGYAIIFVGVGIESMGIPVPGETVLIIGAVLAAQGHLAPWGVALAGWLGAVTGDNIGYYIGHRWGQRFSSLPGIRRFYDERRMAVADRYFERHGMTTIFFGRFVAIVRIFMGPLAGMHHMHWPRFFVANALGAALWVGVIVTIGLLLGNSLDRALTLVKRLGYAGLALAVIVAAGAVAVYLWRQRRERAQGERLLAEKAAGFEDPAAPSTVPKESL